MSEVYLYSDRAIILSLEKAPGAIFDLNKADGASRTEADQLFGDFALILIFDKC